MLGAVFFISIAFCASIFLPGCWKGISREVLATALSVRGPVTYASKGARALHILEPGVRLGAGCSVQVGDNAEVDLMLLPGILVRASRNSDMAIVESKLIKDGDETGGGVRGRAALIRLKQGKATLSYEQPEGTSGSLAVVAGRVTIKAKQDSLFSIETDTSHTRVICVRGQIDASDAAGKSSLIRAGWLQNWGANYPESNLVRADSPAQPEIENALKVGQQLRAFGPPNAFPTY
jgi:hypothetical protein